MAWDGGEGGRQEGRNGIRGKGERDGGQGSGGKHSGRKRERSEERVPPQPAAAGGGGGRSGLHLAEIEQGEKEWRKRQQQEKDREYREQQQQQQSLLQQEGQRKKRQQQQQEQEEEQEEEEEAMRDKKGSEGGSVDDDGESRDDSVGHYQGKPGDVIQGRYVVEKDVGMGTFGRVVQCLDRKRGRKVALKVVRNIKRYTESAQIEADILVDVNSRGGRGMTHCVQLFRDFVFEVGVEGGEGGEGRGGEDRVLCLLAFQLPISYTYHRCGLSMLGGLGTHPFFLPPSLPSAHF